MKRQGRVQFASILTLTICSVRLRNGPDSFPKNPINQGPTTYIIVKDEEEEQSLGEDAHPQEFFPYHIEKVSGLIEIMPSGMIKFLIKPREPKQRGKVYLLTGQIKETS